jgi:hypothetical protein
MTSLSRFMSYRPARDNRSQSLRKAFCNRLRAAARPAYLPPVVAGSMQVAPIANLARMAFCIGGSSRAASRMVLRSHAPSTRSRFARIEAKH